MNKLNLLKTSLSSQANKGLSRCDSFKSDLLSLGVDFKENVYLDKYFYDFECGESTLVKFIFASSGKEINLLDPEAHQKLSNVAKSNEYRCISVFEWDDIHKVALMLGRRRRIYARKCLVEEVDQKTANCFLKQYHLQGSARGQTRCYALYLNGSVVSVMTFGKPRYNRNYEWELIRLCYHPEYLVVGGSEKLWNKFLKDAYPSSVVSYCDKSKFTGNVYYRLGMTLKSEGQPSKHWYSETEQKKSKHITNNFLLQHGYDQIFNEHYGKGTDNEELIVKRGYKPVYDCGQMTFEWYK